MEGGILIPTVLKSLGKHLTNLIYPLSCLICQVKIDPLSEKPICPGCWEKIEYILPPFCRRCGKHLPAQNQNQAFICKSCQQSSYFFRQAYSVCRYDGIIKEGIHLLKYKANLSLVRPLANLMLEFTGNFINMTKIDLILAVPLHRVKQRQRQFNQAHLLAKVLAARFSKPLQHKLLIKVKSGPAQVDLSRRQRLKNVANNFKVQPSKLLQNRNILLIDDVLTTAATVNECAKVLTKAGASRVDVLTLARSM